MERNLHGFSRMHRIDSPLSRVDHPTEPLEFEPPYHPLSRIIEDILGAHHPPESEKLPLTHPEFVEQRHRMAGVDGIQQGAVVRVEFLISPSTRSRVVDDISGIPMKIRITRVDLSEIGEKRRELPITMVDPVPCLVDLRNLQPRDHIPEGAIPQGLLCEFVYMRFPFACHLNRREQEDLLIGLSKFKDVSY